jgi:hypothetical protein
MRRSYLALLAGLFFAANVSAQVSGSAQASGQTDANSSAQVGPSGATSTTHDRASGSASAQANAGHDTLSDGTTFHSTLTSSLDAKKNKPGDKVEARTTEAVKQNGRVVLPKGTRLEGHVTQVQARSKDDAQSTLGIAFDRAILNNGEEMPLHVGIQALADSRANAQSSMGDDAEMMPAPTMSGGGGGGGARAGGVLGGAGQTVGAAAGGATSMASNAAGTVGGVATNAGGAVGSTVNGAARTSSAIGGLDATGHLTSNSQGVFGIQGLQLASTAANDAEGSLVVSATRNVHLDSGTQMLLRASGQAQ